MALKTYVYVDGFNLYYCAVQQTPYRWLNIVELSRKLVPRNSIDHVRYFTSKISGFDDEDKPVRQQLYLRALRTLPEVSITFGMFVTRETAMRRTRPPHERVRVLKTEEKGSDVNLAAHLIHDAHCDRYDVAVVISNDSDLAEAIRIVRGEIGKPVAVVSTRPGARPTFALREAASFTPQLRKWMLKDSQFPHRLIDEDGSFHKPESW